MYEIMKTSKNLIWASARSNEHENNKTKKCASFFHDALMER